MRPPSLTIRSAGAAALAAVLAAGIVIGCGSSSDGASSTTPLTKAEYFQKANAICAAANSARVGLQPGLASPEGRADAAAGLAAAKKAAAELKALMPPAALARRHEDLVSASDRSTAILSTVLTRAEGLANGAIDTTTLEDDVTKANGFYAAEVAAAWSLGLSECAPEPIRRQASPLLPRPRCYFGLVNYPAEHPCMIDLRQRCKYENYGWVCTS